MLKIIRIYQYLLILLEILNLPTAISILQNKNIINKPLVWPMPQSLHSQNSMIQFNLSKLEKFDIKFANFPNEKNKQWIESNLQDCINKFLFKYQNKKQSIATNVTVVNLLNIISFNISISNGDIVQPQLDISENYSLNVNSEIGIQILADTYFGVLRALSTLIQITVVQKQTAKIWQVQIVDYPTYPHRGIMIDTSRHFIPVDIIIKQFDAAFLNKLNVFHWHITDSDSFPLLLKEYPEVTYQGAFSSDEIYDFNDVRKIVEYARSLGIRVIPEIDSPGHTRSFSLSQTFKDTQTCMNCSWYSCAAEPPSGDIDPSLNLTYQLVESLIKQQNEQFPSNQIHLGGDEVNFNCWYLFHHFMRIILIRDSKPSIKENMKNLNISDYEGLLKYYKKIQRNMVQNKSAIYWVQDPEPNKMDFKDGDILQYWGLSSNINEYQNYSQFKIILSPYDEFYLDCGTGNLIGSNSWCDPYKTWLNILQFNPNNNNLTKGQILGSESLIWTEMVTGNQIDGKLWMRSSSLAERHWNNEYYDKFEKNDDWLKKEINQIVERLLNLRNILVYFGINANPITSEWCETNIQSCFNP